MKPIWTAKLHYIQIHIDLEQIGADESQLTGCVLLTWPWVSREEFIVKNMLRAWVCVSKCNANRAFRNCRAHRSTGVIAVYRAPLTAGVSVLMNHKSQYDYLLGLLKETSAMWKAMNKVFLLKLKAAALPVLAASTHVLGFRWETCFFSRDLVSGISDNFMEKSKHLTVWL